MSVARASVVLAVLLSCAHAKDPVSVAAGIAGAKKATVTGELGQPVTVRCHEFGYPAPTVIWYRGRSGPMVPFSNAMYETRESELQIRRLTVETLGEYECQAYNGVGKAATRHVVVRAYRPHNVSTHNPYLVERKAVALGNRSEPAPVAAGIAGPENATVTGELGQPVTVRCRAFGYPAPTVTWRRGDGGAVIPYSSALYETHGLELHIRLLTIETLGEYECQAYNGVGDAATLRVAVRAYRPQSRYLVDREVTETPRPTTPASAAPHNATLQLDLEILRRYTVPVRTSLSATSSVNAGAQLSLPCEVDGYPEPEVRWTKDEAPLTSSDRIWIAGSRLTIERAEVSDSGVYSCLAANAYSSHSSAVRVSVQEMTIPASCVDNPTFANCALIVQSNFCFNKYFSKFCCKSCVQAGQLDPRDDVRM